MLPRTKKLNTKEVERVMVDGKTVRGSFVYIKYIVGDDGEQRFAAIVPKKVSKTSVGRHLLKRRMFEAIHQIQQDFPIGLFVIVVSGGVDGKTLTVDTLVKDLGQITKMVAS